MSKKTLIKTLAIVAALTGLATTSHAITIGDTVDAGGTGELGGIAFTVDFGSVEYVSDLSNGALRFNGTPQAQSTSIFTENLSITGETELAFDWSVVDMSDMKDFSYYQILGLDTDISVFHDGIGMGRPGGTVSRFLNPGDYVLRISSAIANADRAKYQLTVGNLRLNPLNSPTHPGQDLGSDIADVPDSSLGFLGIATIFAIMGGHRFFGSRKREE